MNNTLSPGTPGSGPVTIRQKAILNFSLFAFFLVFYLGAAIVQTPALKSLAVIRVFGIPFGLLMSLLIFPVSWIVIIIWYKKAR
ncbi:MAG TPA: hypothetical protein VJA64_10340 [Desulfobaccales bacterium]|nr:hypothetical protein [Desulfobaccales bacterium]